MPRFPEGSERSQIKGELNYIFSRSSRVTLGRKQNKTHNNHHQNKTPNTKTNKKTPQHKQKNPPKKPHTTFIAKLFGQKDFSDAPLALEALPKWTRDPKKSQKPHSMGMKTMASKSIQKVLPLRSPTPTRNKSDLMQVGENHRNFGAAKPQLWGYRRKRATEGGGFWRSTSLSLHASPLHSHRDTGRLWNSSWPPRSSLSCPV